MGMTAYRRFPSFDVLLTTDAAKAEIATEFCRALVKKADVHGRLADEIIARVVRDLGTEDGPALAPNRV